jgi:hypothetical protein
MKTIKDMLRELNKKHDNMIEVLEAFHNETRNGIYLNVTEDEKYIILTDMRQGLLKAENIIINLEHIKNYLARQITSILVEMDNFSLDLDKYESDFVLMLEETSENNYIELYGQVFNSGFDLKENDPTMFDEELKNYVDSLDNSGDSDYQELEQQKENLEYLLDTEIDNLLLLIRD